jgi:hypothetical protein
MAVIRPLIVGFATTLKHLFKKPITVNYSTDDFVWDKEDLLVPAQGTPAPGPAHTGRQGR